MFRGIKPIGGWAWPLGPYGSYGPAPFKKSLIDCAKLYLYLDLLNLGMYINNFTKCLVFEF